MEHLRRTGPRRPHRTEAGALRILNVDTTRYAPLSPWFANALAEHAASTGAPTDLADEQMLRHGIFSSVQRFSERLRGRPSGLGIFRRNIVRKAQSLQPEMTLVVGGFFVDRTTVERVRRAGGGQVVCVLTDSPFNPRVQSRFMLDALGAYDVVFSTKRTILDALVNHGCRQVEHLEFAYEPALHHPEPPTTEFERERFGCDIAFVGSYEPARADSLLRLHAANPSWKIRAFGGGWPDHPELAERGIAVSGHANGRCYRLAVGGAKLALSYPRWDNGDTTSMRTFELPAMGGCLLAEYSDDQAALLQPGVEAAYFRDDDELVAQATRYLDDEAERSRLAAAGRQAIVAGGHAYRDRLAQILATVSAPGRCCARRCRSCCGRSASTGRPCPSGARRSRSSAHRRGR